MTPFEWLLLISLSMLWGGSYFFVNVAVRELPTLVIVVCRIGSAALILLAVMPMLGQRMPNNLGVWAAFFAMGFLNNTLPFSLVVWGQSHVGIRRNVDFEWRHAVFHGPGRPCIHQ